MVNSSFVPRYRPIDYGQGGILGMRAPPLIQMMRILHQARVGNIRTNNVFLAEWVWPQDKPRNGVLHL